MSSAHKAAALALQASCSAANLEGFVQPDRMPFVAKSDLPTSAVIGALEIKAGKVLGQGDYTVTKEIKGFKFAKQRLLAGSHPIFTQADEQPLHPDDKHHFYSLKTLKAIEPDNPLDAPAAQSATAPAEAYQTAAQRLIQETLYLAALSAEFKPCPFLLPFRGFWMSDAESFDQQQLDACHLVTDRLGETLEERMKTWKFSRHQAQRRKSTSSKKFILQSVQMDLNTPEAKSLLMHKSKRPKSTNPPPQIHAESLSRSRHKMLLQLPKLEQYPDDLVALQTNYVLQIAHALEFLHQRGIVVRDLRPNTIGFKEYPHHHQIQLFHFGHCRELNRDGWIEPENISALSSTLYNNPQPHSSTSERDSQTSQDITVDNSQQFRLDNSQQFKLRESATSSHSSPSSDAKHYRAPESYPLVPAPPPRGDPNDKMLLLHQQDSLHKIHTGGTTVTRTHNNITCVTKTLMRNNTPAEEDGYKYEQGYNCKADIYSLMMIYFEMLADAKPFGKSAITREGHYYRVQSHGLRPSLNKHHFPRTIKAVLEGGWNPDIQQRSSATHVRQLLTNILPMLEGKGLPIRKKTTPSSLPSRAAALLVPHNVGNGWGSVWSRTRSTRKLDGQQVMATIQAHRVNRDKKKDAQNEHLLDIEGKKSKKKNKHENKPVVQKTWREYLPILRRGMVQSEMNDRTAKILLGESVYNDKKQRQENNKAFKKAYC